MTSSGFPHAVRLHIALLFIFSLATLIGACGQDAFTDEDNGGGGGPNPGKTRNNFSGIYKGSLGSLSSPSPNYFQNARLFVTTNGEGFLYATLDDTTDSPLLSGTVVSAFSLGTRGAGFSANQFTMQTYAYYLNTGNALPNPTVSENIIFSGTVENKENDPQYTKITSTSIAASGNQSMSAPFTNMQNAFTFTNVEKEDTIALSQSLLQNFNPWTFTKIASRGYSTNSRNLGSMWTLTITGNGSFTVAIDSTGTPSNCIVNSGNIAIIGAPKNQFDISFSLSGCNELELNGQYTGVGHLSTNPNQQQANFGMSFAVQKSENNAQLISFFGGRGKGSF